MVEGARLESVYTSNRIVGSNPTLSAINLNFWQILFSCEKGFGRTVVAIGDEIRPTRWN